MGAEINYDEVFGVDTSGQGESAGSGTEPAPGSRTASGDGGKAQDQEDAPEHKDTDPEDDADGDAGEGEVGKGESPELTPEQRSKNAARRRKHEVEEAVEKARQETQEAAKKQWDDFFASAGLKNPLDGNKPITNLAEYQAYKAQHAAAQLQKNLREGKLTPEALSKVVEETPIMKKAQKLISQVEAEEAAAKKAQAQVKIKEELAEIGKLDPSIKTVEDLLKMERAEQFREYVRRGNSFYDAFYLSNRDKLSKTAQTAAQQQALNLANSKAHLTSTAARGTGAISVPPEEIALYREFNPKATDAEIQKHYNSYKKK